jgi:hypothetical protein
MEQQKHLLAIGLNRILVMKYQQGQRRTILSLLVLIQMRARLVLLTATLL